MLREADCQFRCPRVVFSSALKIPSLAGSQCDVRTVAFVV